jgi:4a-hydroxytetrahydrobiopterin dehydratase
MKDLHTKKCVPCEGGMPSFPDIAIREYVEHVPGWSCDYAVTPRKIFRDFKFKNFVEAMKFVNTVADIAEGEQHHPDIHVSYNKVRIEIWTHAAKGLTENDFIIAAKINQLDSRKA